MADSRKSGRTPKPTVHSDGTVAGSSSAASAVSTVSQATKRSRGNTPPRSNASPFAVQSTTAGAGLVLTDLEKAKINRDRAEALTAEQERKLKKKQKEELDRTKMAKAAEDAQKERLAVEEAIRNSKAAQTELAILSGKYEELKKFSETQAKVILEKDYQLNELRKKERHDEEMLKLLREIHSATTGNARRQHELVRFGLERDDLEGQLHVDTSSVPSIDLISAAAAGGIGDRSMTVPIASDAAINGAVDLLVRARHFLPTFSLKADSAVLAILQPLLGPYSGAVSDRLRSKYGNRVSLSIMRSKVYQRASSGAYSLRAMCSAGEEFDKLRLEFMALAFPGVPPRKMNAVMIAVVHALATHANLSSTNVSGIMTTQMVDECDRMKSEGVDIVECLQDISMTTPTELEKQGLELLGSLVHAKIRGPLVKDETE